MSAFFRATVADFLATSSAQGLDQLTAGLAAQGFDLTPDQRVAWVEEWARLQTVLASLSEEQKTLVLLADVEGLPYKEISELMGKPVGTIRSRLHRTHKLMRQRLDALKAHKESQASAEAKPNARQGKMVLSNAL